MKIFNNERIPINYKNPTLAIGNFDGVHIGHQKVFQQARKIANKNKTKFGVLTFSPLPVMFFNKEVKNFRLSSEDQKIKLFKKNKVDFIINIKFNKKFSNLSAENFIKKIIYKKINPKFIAVSNNFKFGKNRKGNIALLEKFNSKYNYKLLNIKPFKSLRQIVSSTKIRKYLKQGSINLANKLLSRTWSIEGYVGKGKKIGRKLGYRTCNMDIKNYVLPKLGIYSVRVSIQNQKKLYSGVAYLGSRPTFDGKKVFLETNIFGIKKNLYKKKNNRVFLEIFKK